MSAVDPLQSSLFFTAAAQAAQTKRREDEKKAGATKKNFVRALEQAKENEATENSEMPAEIANMAYDQAVQTLLDSVYASGDVLKKNANTEAVKMYKKAVKDFVHFVVKNSYEVDLYESARGIKKRKKFCQIQIIDQKLDNLATGVLYNNRDQLALLAKIDELNGILVDLIS